MASDIPEPHDNRGLFDKRIGTRTRTMSGQRSGVQNIAEGSAASVISQKMEIKLTGVAWASLEELELDFEDYFRHWGLPQWEPEHPILTRFKATCCADLPAFHPQRDWQLSGGDFFLHVLAHGQSAAQGGANPGQGIQVGFYSGNGGVGVGIWVMERFWPRRKRSVRARGCLAWRCPFGSRARIQ